MYAAQPPFAADVSTFTFIEGCLCTLRLPVIEGIVGAAETGGVECQKKTDDNYEIISLVKTLCLKQ